MIRQADNTDTDTDEDITEHTTLYTFKMRIPGTYYTQAFVYEVKDGEITFFDSSPPSHTIQIAKGS